MCQLLTLDLEAAVAAYAAAMDDAVRAFASQLGEPCCRACVTFYRPDGTPIAILDVPPAPAFTVAAETSGL
jgi:hypothetical protein